LGAHSRERRSYAEDLGNQHADSDKLYNDSVTLHSDSVWALKDINFSVEQREVLGFIEKNGADKSTLFKILSKVTAPTTGNVKVKGPIAN